jgi:hypothetical protein
LSAHCLGTLQVAVGPPSSPTRADATAASIAGVRRGGRAESVLRDAIARAVVALPGLRLPDSGSHEGEGSDAHSSPQVASCSTSAVAWCFTPGVDGVERRRSTGCASATLLGSVPAHFSPKISREHGFCGRPSHSGRPFLRWVVREPRADRDCAVIEFASLRVAPVGCCRHWRVRRKRIRTGYARRERSSARATCSRDRAPTADVSAMRQRSGVPAPHSSRRSAKTAA